MDISKLHPLSPEIIINQSTINIGTIGHVAHGKTTVVHAISGVKTNRWKKELERNITMRLGYANAKIYKCDKCPTPQCYQSRGSAIWEEPVCRYCGGPMELIRHISFVDCPGHETLMAVMLNGAAVMDSAFLLIAANEDCPQPQTSEHLTAVQNMNLKHIIVLQNKIDRVRQEEAMEQYNTILRYTSTTAAKDAPVIPISAQFGYNIDFVVESIVKTIPVPPRDYSSAPRMIVIRSFDINKPGRDVRELEGGVAGGSILQGCLRLNDEIEIRPGELVQGDHGPYCRVMRAKIVSLKADENKLEFAVPGGLIGVGTTLDPCLCRADRLAGQVIGRPGTLPDVFMELTVEFRLWQRLLGVVQSGTADTKIRPLQDKELLRLHVGSTAVFGWVIGLAKNFAVIKLNGPVCTSIGDRIALSRKIDMAWKLIGWAKILKGNKIAVVGPDDD